MGKPLRGYEAAILDDDGREQKRGEPGHLVLRNDHPGLTLGYRKAAARWAAVNRDGWYYTQDIAYVDSDGYFWYVSRSDDLIKSRAYLISPKEVESALLEHPAVLEAAVVGIPDPQVGARVKGFVALRAGHAASDALAEEIRDYVRGVIAPYKVPHQSRVHGGAAQNSQRQDSAPRAARPRLRRAAQVEARLPRGMKQERLPRGMK